MKKPGLLVVLSSPSGGGKTTVGQRLLQADPRVVRSISATTREPRGDEQAGQDYFFLTQQQFQQLRRERRFLEWAKVHSHYYGTLAAAVRRHQRQGKDVLLTIDVQGGLAVKKMDPQAVLIFLKPPSWKALETRLRQRNTDSRQTIRERLRNARWEMTFAPRYDYVVVNEKLDEAVFQVRAVLTAERLRNRK